MFDQSFSPENLRIITESENRRGSNKSLDFFPSVFQATDVLKDCIRATKQFRAARKHKYSKADQAIFDALKENRENARKKRDDELLSCLKDVSDNISQKHFRISIKQSGGPHGKPVYVIPDTPIDSYAQSYYAINQIGRNISRIYKVKQANRNQIVSQLKDCLSDGFPYHVIKLDVQSFYESIDHSALISKLKADQLLSATTLRLVEHLLWDYAQLAGTAGKGLPRGIGISALLSELFMRDFDRNVSSLPEVAFYARYVDDIVVLFAQTNGSQAQTNGSQIGNYLNTIVKQLERMGLQINQDKTKQAPPETALTYLGYEFKDVCKASFQVRISDAKYKK